MSGTARSLADLDAALDRLERDGTRFWTALDGSGALPSKAKPLTEQGFGRFGQLGRLADEDEARNVANSDVARPAAARHADESERRIESYSNTVQTVQTVQSDEKCPPEQAVSFGQSDPLAVQNRGSAVQSAGQSIASWTCEGEDAATCRPPKPCRGTEPSSAARRHDALNRWLAANPSPRASAAGVGVISTGRSRNGSMRAPPEMPPDCRRARAHRAELIENLRNEADHCSRCGAPTQPLEIGGADRSGWICNACLNAAGLLMIRCADTPPRNSLGVPGTDQQTHDQAEIVAGDVHEVAFTEVLVAAQPRNGTSYFRLELGRSRARPARLAAYCSLLDHIAGSAFLGRSCTAALAVVFGLRQPLGVQCALDRALVLAHGPQLIRRHW